jgi:hypothetical protein
MLLRNFADADQMLAMVSRDEPRQVKLTKVRTACAEVGFYTIPTDDVAPSHQAGHDPESVEKLLSQVEGSTAPIFADMVQSRFPPSEEQRFQASLFVALQISRGWRFRYDVNAFATLAARRQLPTLATDERIRRYLRQRGKASGSKAVDQFRRRLLAEDAFTVHMSQPFAVQQALRFAVETLQPLLFFRTWRLLRFREPLRAPSFCRDVGFIRNCFQGCCRGRPGCGWSDARTTRVSWERSFKGSGLVQAMGADRRQGEPPWGASGLLVSAGPWSRPPDQGDAGRGSRITTAVGDDRLAA